MERLTNEPDSATFSPGVDRALEILEQLGSEPLTLSELSAKLGFPNLGERLPAGMLRRRAVTFVPSALPARGRQQRDLDALGRVLRQRAAAAERLVVGMREHRHQSQ